VDLKGAADRALKSKIIAALVAPGHAHNPSMSPMERMGLLYQLSDSVFEEAVLESDEKAELSQAQFTAVLKNFGLGELLANKAALDTLLLKGLTATSTPEKPVSVEPFMNWLTSEENSRARAPGRSPLHFCKVYLSIITQPRILFNPSTTAAAAKKEPEPEPEQKPAPAPPVEAVPVAAPEPEPTAAAIASNSEPPAEQAPSVPEPATAKAPSPAPGEGSARASGTATPTSVKEQTDSARATSPIGVLSPAESQKSASAANPSTARSAGSTEDRETQERKQEEFRQSLQYQPKEMEISTIVIEGEQLVHAFYDTVLVNVKIGVQEWNATTCMAREKGSKRRSYNVKWPEMLISADAFRNDHAIITVAVHDAAVASENPAVPYLKTTSLGEAPHSIKIPMYYFMAGTFDVNRELQVTPIVAAKVGTTVSSGVIKVSIHGNARDPKGVRTARIMSMRPQDLMNIKFDPIPLDDAEDLYESDHESVDSAAPRRGRKSGSIPEESPKDAQDEDELTRTLFPKASLANMSTLAGKTPGAPLMNSLVT
jgi:outer membrane biosynthesis protein TonB